MFANEAYTGEQDERYDQITQPGGLWLRIRSSDREVAKMLLGKEKADPYEYFTGAQAPLDRAVQENGYRQNPGIHMQIEYHCHAEYHNPPSTHYAYVPIVTA